MPRDAAAYRALPPSSVGYGQEVAPVQDAMTGGPSLGERAQRLLSSVAADCNTPCMMGTFAGLVACGAMAVPIAHAYHGSRGEGATFPDDMPEDMGANLLQTRVEVAEDRQKKKKAQALATVSFTINGKSRTVDAHLASHTLLSAYLRENELLKGTKLSCREGGCGACTVLLRPLKKTDSAAVPVNACLRLLAACDGYSITTVEGLGNTKNPSQIQKEIAENYGTQCGFCSAGMVTTLTALAQKAKGGSPPTAKEIEDQLSGNICRCTGYTNIVAAAKKVLQDPAQLQLLQTGDIEDLGGKSWKAQAAVPLSHCSKSCTSVSGPEYYMPKKLESAWQIMSALPGVALIGANTGAGVLKYYDGTSAFAPFKSPPAALMDVSRVEKMLRTSYSSPNEAVELGASVPLQQFLEISAELEEKGVSATTRWMAVAAHLKRVAGHQVRSVGTIGGNLMMANRTPLYPSDVMLLLSGLEARIKIGRSKDEMENVSMADFHKSDTTGKLLVSVEIPAVPQLAANERELVYTYKSALRRENAHAILHAYFAFIVKQSEDGKGVPAIRSACVYYGGLVPGTVLRATQAESALAGAVLGDSKALQKAVNALDSVVAQADPVFGKTEYRKTLVRTYLFKALLQASAASGIKLRPQLSLAAQPPEWKAPVHKWETKGAEGVFKSESKPSALAQCTGEASYTDDLPRQAGQLFGCFVLAQAIGTLTSVSSPAAENLEGVVAVITAKDFASKGYGNLLTPTDTEEEILTSSNVRFIGQRVALVVARSREIAELAARLVQANIKPADTPPIITLDQAIAKKSFWNEQPKVGPNPDTSEAEMEGHFQSADVVVEGSASCGNQYHFHMETHTCCAAPDGAGGIEIDVSTQNPVGIANDIAAVLGLDQTQVTARMTRAGGGFGGKINRPRPVAVAAACAAHMLEAPVSIVLSLNDNMLMMGGRKPYRFDYKIACKRDGTLVAVTGRIYSMVGASFDLLPQADVDILSNAIDACYKIPHWRLEAWACRANVPSTTYCRGPVYMPGQLLMDAAIDHLAHAAGLNPHEVRLKNLYKDGVTPFDQSLENNTLSLCVQGAMQNCDFDQLAQQVTEFNQVNSHIKQGLSLTPFKYGMGPAMGFRAFVAVRPDGSVLVQQSGCEIGQGLDSKQRQAAALVLNAPLERVFVAGTTSQLGTWMSGTGGSTTSEANVASVTMACEKIKARMDERLKAEAGKSWEERVKACAGLVLADEGIYFGQTTEHLRGAEPYTGYGCAISHVQYDSLLSEVRVLRAELMTDQGTSLNPGIDAGQVQGAYVMGLGYVLTEEYAYSEQGQLTTNGTWEYKVPTVSCVPEQFDITFLANTPHPKGIFGSKASGEPAVLGASSALSALRAAAAAVRADYGNSDPTVLNAPATVEAMLNACTLDPSKFSF
eukprot:TRINITY_DN6446_c0_g2_i1.p1 TRINITY_DN6446_c0_g2~~TRINITY_DN6446_c0_g2_i1.p1  ORF type:complete len:1409 (-),score=252.41 TRINITY_DN6446_c0_g2_i1:261-4487(-)